MIKNHTEEIIVKYKNGASLKGLGREYKSDKRHIKNLLIKNGVEIKIRNNGKRKHDLKHNYFEVIDSPQKAYLLGLMFADGYILKDGYCSGISLVRDDIHLLNFFSQEIFGSEDPVYDITREQFFDGHLCRPVSRLIIKSREFQRHLLDKNLVHNKSLILTPPSNLPEKFTKYFIHGFFDGNGYFSNQWGIISTPAFVEWVKEYLFSQNLITKGSLVMAENKKNCRLHVHRINDIIRLFNFFYSEDLPYPFLTRKRDKMQEFILSRPESHPNRLE